MWASRGSVSKATGTRIGSETLGIILHPSLLIERRDSTKISESLFLRDSVAAGTVLCLVPFNSAIHLSNLRKAGVASRHSWHLSSSSSSSSSESDPIGRLLDSSFNEWAELAWRLSLEAASTRGSVVSTWWHWLDSLTSSSASSCSASQLEFSLRFPSFAGDATSARNSISKAQQASFEKLFLSSSSSPSLVPSFDSWKWATKTLLEHAIISPFHGTTILPILDLASHALEDSKANAVLSLIQRKPEEEEEEEGFEPNELPTWVIEQRKQQVADLSSQVVEQRRDQKKGPRAKRIGLDAIRQQMTFSSRKSQTKTKGATTRRMEDDEQNYYLLETTKDLMPGDELFVNWLHLTPLPRDSSMDARRFFSFVRFGEILV